MPESIVTTEIVDQDISILEESPMTEGEEKELVIVKTAISTAYADKLERNLAIGAGLHQIFKRKLYRGKNGGRSWDSWLAEESKELTKAEPLNRKTAQRLRAFYRFRVEILASRPEQASVEKLPLPTSHYQVDPLLGQLDSHPEAAIAMWKAAVTEAKGAVPTTSQVHRAAIAHKANQANEARRLTEGQRERLRLANAGATAAANRSDSEPLQDYSPTSSPKPSPAPSIPAWEIETHDDSVDAGAECKRITQALNDAHKSVGLLRGILYSQINKYGRDYMGVLRQVDAGVYSLSNIDDQVQQLGEDVEFISALLKADVGEGELARSTIDVNSMPSRA